MPRTAQRGLLLRKIIYIIELLLLSTKNEISSDSMVLEITYDLLDLYQEISRHLSRTTSCNQRCLREPDWPIQKLSLSRTLGIEVFGYISEFCGAWIMR
ncbi:hypothetical protein L211DRAFT_333509 [Terfezia boudieri ATCC MYA-4762]|uniref:Uncharacterized protein n=1 Tax=Terfezia boudieri ATCC MYA-4762 TaxID=1051890 RepID=A0A3N4LHH2_9PEZI|nr:hypothetical protein L211DRAFT_333509 [Terfezia boudieri ATCC MYA-4762]